MYQLRLTSAADTNLLPTHRFKIQSTEPPNNHHIENRIPIASTTPTRPSDSSNSNDNDIKGNKCHIINAATTPSIQTNDETTLHELLDNDNDHDKVSNVKIPSTTKDDSPTTTRMTTTTSLLWIFLLMTTITRAATLAIQRPVIKGGTTACLFYKASTVSVGGQQLKTNDDIQVLTWDVWLWKKSRTAIETDHMDMGNNIARY